MCGFGGIINNKFLLNQKQIAEIACKANFRGPDSQGIVLFDAEFRKTDTGNTAFFFNRLAIIDLDKRSNQPFEDDRYLLIFNGEIYNYIEIKNLLIIKGFIFHTTSDTEVLFNALKYWGVSAISMLNGMFAFCFFDKDSKSFIIARDRLGIKPLYYRQLGESIIFASDLNSVIRLSHDRPLINSLSLEMYLWMQFIPTPFTPFLKIFKLQPGHFIEGSLGELTLNEVKPTEFWNSYKVHNSGSISKYSEFEDVLVKSIERQLVADVPLGLFLSSGVDSSLLAAIINKHFAKKEDINFFTVSFNEPTIYDESIQAENYLAGFNNPKLKHHKLEIDASYIGGHLTNLYEYIDEPFGDYTSLLNWVISKEAKKHVTVALSGDGADELFWGYPRYQQWKLKELKLKDKVSLRGQFTTLSKYILPHSHFRSLASFVSELNDIKRHFTLFLHPAFSNLTANPVFEQEIWAMKGISEIDGKGDLTSILDIKTYLADAMLFKVDRTSMAASLEIRVPYLDNEVVDYALNMPLISKSNAEFQHKAPLKNLLAKLGPHYNFNIPKKGFNFPLNEWLFHNWKDKALATLSKEHIDNLGLDGGLYMKVVESYYKGNKRNSIPVWYLLNLMLWKEKFNSIPPLKNYEKIPGYYN